MKYWEIIPDNLKKAGWSWGCVSAIDSNGRTIWIADGTSRRRFPRSVPLIERESCARTTQHAGQGI